MSTGSKPREKEMLGAIHQPRKTQRRCLIHFQQLSISQHGSKEPRCHRNRGLGTHLKVILRLVLVRNAGNREGGPRMPPSLVLTQGKGATVTVRKAQSPTNSLSSLGKASLKLLGKGQQILLPPHTLTPSNPPPVHRERPLWLGQEWKKKAFYS